MTKKEQRYIPVVKSEIFFIKQLDNLGINRRYLGFYYLIEILNLLINQGIKVKSYSNQIYPIVAAKYKKSEWTIERNIRNLIDKCWSVDLLKRLNIFYHSNKKPSCCKFIELLKMYINSQIL